MTFDSAIDSLSSGQAAKRPSWLGYVKRTDITAAPAAKYPAFAASTSYAVGDRISDAVTVSGTTSYYVCKTAHTSAVTFATSGEADNWIQVSDVFGYNLTFVERSEDTSATATFVVGDDGVTEYAFGFTKPVVSGDSVSGWECETEPRTDTSVTPNTHTLEVDASLMNAFLASDWTVGNTSDYDNARSGTGARW